MSYILEALKKSQQERQLGKVPTLDTSQVEAEPREAEPTRWIYSAVVLALTAIIVAGYGIVDRRTSAPSANNGAVSASSTPAVRSTPRTTMPAAASHMPTAPVLATAAPSASTSDPLVSEMGIHQGTLEPGPVPFELFGAEPPAKPAAASPVPGSEPAPFLAEEHPAPSSLPMAEDDNAIPLLRQLDYEFRQTVPAISLDVHVYRENPDRRFVLIIETLYREGEQTAEGPVVEEIAPNGVILSYQGTLFRLGT